MILTVRLDADLQAALERSAEARQVTVSEFVRAAIAEKIAREGKPTPWDAGKDVFGCFDSGHGTLGRDHEEVLRERARTNDRR